jgi:molecular chaperone HscB
MEYYQVLGLEPKLSLDLEDLKERFYGRSRLWHPDHFVQADPLERERALDMTALLNDAFRILREPSSRAEYFLKQHGLELSKDPPPELLEEVFDLNLMMEELREGDSSARRDLESARDRFAGMLAQIDAELHELFASYDLSQSREILDEIQQALSRRRYISNLVRDANKELNVPGTSHSNAAN